MILPPGFVDSYRKRTPSWGFPSGPNSIGELTYRRTYRRGDEEWADTVARVVRGVYDILKRHCDRYRLPFDDKLASSDAREMFDRIWSFKFTPPGRGLWIMGTDFVTQRGGMPLLNCAFCSTENIDTEFDKPFRFLMDVSMLGVGCGFDTRGAGKLQWSPGKNTVPYVIPDSREGWVASVGLLLRWGFGVGPLPEFDYSLIRPKGEPIKGFGGVCEGPDDLRELHGELVGLIRNADDRPDPSVTSRDIVDVMNLIGKCVVAGNVRRTAEISFGDPLDEDYLDLKDYDKNPERAAYGWTSNNSVFAEVGMDYSRVAERTAKNGEPGYAWLRNMREYGRMKDPPDYKDMRVCGANPCNEQSLESYECCCLVETYPAHHDTPEDFFRTLKYAFLYAKAVTLLPTHWEETNAVQLRNRRIGTSVSGVAQALTALGERALFEDWLDPGYGVLQHYDRKYSEWLAVRESIKLSSVKPSGTVSLLAGATPGCHYPTHRTYIRRIRYSKSHPDLKAIKAAGYPTEPSAYDKNTEVVEFPVKGPEVPTEREKTLEEKLDLAVKLQHFWADNQVSFTGTFLPEEATQIPGLLGKNDGKLKGASFLPIQEGVYAQMPYEAITEEEYDRRVAGLKKIRWPKKESKDVEDRFCDGVTCESAQQTRLDRPQS